MDSQERHDLKENDLAEFFNHFGDWWNKWGNTVLVIAVVLLGSVAVYRFVTYQNVTQHDGAWGDLAATTSPEGYQDVAQSYSNEAVTALAYLRGAELFHQRAMQTAAANIVADDDSTPTAETDLEQAKLMYQGALEASEHPAYRANALLGLGAVAESQKDWTAAAGYYTQAVEETGETYPALAAQAQQRQNLLDELQRPVAFGPEVVLPALQGMSGMPDINFDALAPNAGSAFPDDQTSMEDIIRSLGGDAEPAVTDEPDATSQENPPPAATDE